MSRVDAAAPMDRLPWLPDEPQPQPARQGSGLVLSAGIAILAVAAGGFWLGTRSFEQEAQAPAQRSEATTTVRLPRARPEVPQVRTEPQQDVRLAPVPEVTPAPTSEVHLVSPRPQRPAKREAIPSTAKEEQTAPAATTETQAVPPTAVAPPAPPRFVLPKPWPPRVVKGAAGRLVEIGAFGSVPQAKFGWRYMVRAYPAMTHLPAVVRPDRNSKGRVFYRFRVGTTSQAHSEVLCQRMRKIGLSCAVVGLPWKSKVER